MTSGAYLSHVRHSLTEALVAGTRRGGINEALEEIVVWSVFNLRKASVLSNVENLFATTSLFSKPPTTLFLS